MKNLKPRPPIVSVLGHVDHGKTTLLDAIRKTNVAKKEAGGITQGIGATTIKTKSNKKITFLDTPGHAAFEKMRSRGASACDIAILVIALDDGVKPQTREAIKHIISCKTPFLVALTKTDLKRGSVDVVKDELEKEGVKVEGKGGNIPVALVSGKTGEGIEDLLDLTLLLAEMEDIKADENGLLEAVVIETNKDKRGPVVSVVVKDGKLKVGDEIGSDKVSAKVKGLFDENGKGIKQVLPGEPALILGFSDLPQIGSLVTKSEKGKALIKERQINKTKKLEEGELPIIIKASNAGSLEAVLENLPQNSAVINSSIGDVTEADIFLAKASGPAYIFVFESKASSLIKKLAKTEGIEIFEFDIIYKLFEKLEEIILGKQKKVLGKLEILAEFPFNKKRIAGCVVLMGEIKKGDKLILEKKRKEAGKARIMSMKKQKTEIDSAKQGEECGLLLKPQLDFEIGDMLVSVANE